MLKRNVFSSYFIEFSMVHSPSPPPSYMLGACNLGTATWTTLRHHTSVTSLV